MSDPTANESFAKYVNIRRPKGDILINKPDAPLPSEYAFVLQSYSFGVSRYHRETRPRWFKRAESRIHDETERRFREIIRRSPEAIQVAATKDDDDQLLGWIMSEGPILHYVYVKRAFRRHGVGGFLLASNSWGELRHTSFPWKPQSTLFSEVRYTGFTAPGVM